MNGPRLPSWRIELLLRSELSDDSQRFGRVDVSVFIDRDATRHKQCYAERGLVVAPGCATTSNHERIAVLVDFQDTVVERISDVNVAGAIRRDGAGGVDARKLRGSDA